MPPCDVSVIISAYNQNAALELLLSLLAKQEYAGRWEIIVCDDGSDEDTLGVVRAASLHSERRLRYVWQSRDGWSLSKSRNNALRCADGDILILMDADLLVAPDFVARHANCHSDGKRRVVCGIRRWLFLDDLPRGTPLSALVPAVLTSKTGLSALYSEVESQKKFANSPYPWLSVAGCNFSFSRHDQTILFDEAFSGWGGEDKEFACRLHVRHGYAISLEPELVGLHLEGGHRRFIGIRPKSHDEIVQFLRNMVYFCDCYPQLDMSPAFENLGYLELDAASNTWRHATRPSFSQDHIHWTFATAQRWLADSGLRQVAS